MTTALTHLIAIGPQSNGLSLPLPVLVIAVVAILGAALGLFLRRDRGGR